MFCLTVLVFIVITYYKVVSAITAFKLVITKDFNKRCKVKQSRYRPGVAQRVQEFNVPRFLDSGAGWW
jgi:hypothetical protein